MPVRQQQKKTYQTFQGKKIDMDTLRQRNELTPAVGNARVNARGDELGPGGKIIRKREDVMADYYRDNPNVVADEQPVAKKADPVEAVVNEAPVAKKATKKVEKETVVEDEWVEDDDGNFVKRGD